MLNKQDLSNSNDLANTAQRLHLETSDRKVKIQPSSLPCAGMGAFAVEKLPELFKLGEYRGVVLTQEEFDQLPEDRACYVFEKQIRTGTKMKKLYVDARILKHSNWTRYVNGAKTDEQKKLVNTECYQYGGKLWYRTTKEVLPGEELIIDYGEEYWTDSEDESDVVMSD